MKNENYRYLLRLYSLVDEYLADTPDKQENLPEIIVAFCVVTEKLFKIRLHKENPVLVYENTKLKEDDVLVSVIKGKEISVETIRIRETLSRYKLVFQDEFSDDEEQVLIDIYNLRNHFIHGYKPDEDILSDKENIIKKMGTVWEKISIQAISIFGKVLIKANKPKKKYSEHQLEKVLIEEVRKKIQSTEIGGTPIFGLLARNFEIQNLSSIDQFSVPSSTFGLAGEQCPRCGSYGFSLDIPDLMFSVAYSTSRTFSDLYKCKKCNLELTRKEYEIARRLKMDYEK